MCFSSSTTRIFEFIVAPMASNSSPRRQPAVLQRSAKCNRGLFCPPGPRPAPLFRPEDELERVADQAEAIADLLLQVAPVREVQQAGVVDDYDQGRRLVLRRCGLRA